MSAQQEKDLKSILFLLSKRTVIRNKKTREKRSGLVRSKNMTEDERKDLFFPLASRVHRKREQVKKRVVYCKDDAASGSREGRKELFFLFFLYEDRTTELTRFRQTQRMCASELCVSRHTKGEERGERKGEERREEKKV